MSPHMFYQASFADKNRAKFDGSIAPHDYLEYLGSCQLFMFSLGATYVPVGVGLVQASFLFWVCIFLFFLSILPLEMDAPFLQCHI